MSEAKFRSLSVGLLKYGMSFHVCDLLWDKNMNKKYVCMMYVTMVEIENVFKK